VLIGGTGTGKSHLTVSIARACIRNGARGRFFNVVDLVNKLDAEARAGRQDRTADLLCRLDLLILDELGYLPFAQTGGQLLFHLISRLVGALAGVDGAVDDGPEAHWVLRVQGRAAAAAGVSAETPRCRGAGGDGPRFLPPPRFFEAAVRAACSCRRKNRGQDQCAPVMAQAMAESERCRSPRQRKPPSATSTTWVTPFHSRSSRPPGFSPGVVLMLSRPPRLPAASAGWRP